MRVDHCFQKADALGERGGEEAGEGGEDVGHEEECAEGAGWEGEL